MTSIKNHNKITLALATSFTMLFAGIALAQNPAANVQPYIPASSQPIAPPDTGAPDLTPAQEIKAVEDTSNDLASTLNLANDALTKAKADLEVVTKDNQPKVDMAKDALDVANTNLENAKNIAENAANVAGAVLQLDKASDPEGKMAAAAKLNDQTAKSNIDNATKSVTDSQAWYDDAIKPINDAQAVVDTAQKQVDEAKLAVDEAKKTTNVAPKKAP